MICNDRIMFLVSLRWQCIKNSNDKDKQQRSLSYESLCVFGLTTVLAQKAENVSVHLI